MNPFLLESFFLLDGEFWVKLNGKDKREKRREGGKRKGSGWREGEREGKEKMEREREVGLLIWEVMKNVRRRTQNINGGGLEDTRGKRERKRERVREGENGEGEGSGIITLRGN